MAEPVKKIRSREELEREILSLKDRLGYCVEGAKRAAVAFRVLVSEERKKELAWKLNHDILHAIGREPSWTGPALAAHARVSGIAFAMEEVMELRRKGGGEWKAACDAVLERLKGHCQSKDES